MSQTKIALKRGERIVAEIEVPFSQEEITKIEALRSLKQLLSSEAMTGSGVIRELYNNLEIPWGHVLKDREQSKVEFQSSLSLIETTLDRIPNEFRAIIENMKVGLAELISSF